MVFLKTIKEIMNDIFEDTSNVVDGDEELEGYKKGWNVGFNAGVIAFILENKENAIKWIKEIKLATMRNADNEEAYAFDENTINWIKHFHNIIDKDLM